MSSRSRSHGRLEIAWHLAHRLVFLGDFALDADSLDDAAGLYRESLEISVRLGDDWGIARTALPASPP